MLRPDPFLNESVILAPNYPSLRLLFSDNGPPSSADYVYEMDEVDFYKLFVEGRWDDE